MSQVTQVSVDISSRKLASSNFVLRYEDPWRGLVGGVDDKEGMETGIVTCRNLLVTRLVRKMRGSPLPLLFL